MRIALATSLAFLVSGFIVSTGYVPGYGLSTGATYQTSVLNSSLPVLIALVAPAFAMLAGLWFLRVVQVIGWTSSVVGTVAIVFGACSYMFGWLGIGGFVAPI